MKVAAVAMLAATATGGCTARVRTPPEWDRLEAEEGVFVAVLNRVAADRHARRLLVRRKTSLGFLHEQLPDHFGKSVHAFRVLDSTAAEDFARMNEQSRSIERIGHTESRVDVVDDSVLGNPDATGSNDFFGHWHRLRDRFGDGTAVVTLSRPGFDRARKKAVMVLTYACGALCGAGYNVILRKEDTGWVVAKMVETWVS
jgi:hypothetical protein